VPLSEHEQRVLEQIERALYADDPKFAATVRGIDPEVYRRRRLVRAALATAAGVAMVPLGIVFGQYEITFAGALLMLLALLYAGLTIRQASDRARRRQAAPAPQPGLMVREVPGGRSHRAPRPQRAAGRRGFMERMEDRWSRRREDLGR
jgi:Protein of unknown function (DUF3040)